MFGLAFYDNEGCISMKKLIIGAKRADRGD